MQDSNLRMHESKSCALPTWLIPNMYGERTGIRTPDTRLRRALLYPAELCTHFNLERVKGIEPSQLAWKARTLPLSYTREYWWLIGESNPCYRRERAVSWPLDQWATILSLLVAEEGLEPPTFGLWARRATELLHPAISLSCYISIAQKKIKIKSFIKRT